MPKKKTNYSFTWVGTPNELRILFKKMIDSKLIAPETTEVNFKAIFEAKPLDEVEPITWLKSNALLAYFANCLENKISFNDNYNRFKVAEACFKPSKYLKQASNNYNANKTSKPRHYKLVDELF